MALTVSEIAKTLAYSKSHVLNLLKSGQLSAMPRRNPRGKYLIDEAEFARFQEHVASKDTTGREFAYILLNRYVGQLPDVFDRSKVSQSIGSLSSELNSASHALAPLQHPYQYWSWMLSETSSYIDLLRQSDLFTIIHDGDNMRLLQLLAVDLRACIHRLRSALTSKQDPTVTKELLALRDAMLEWSGFCKSWADFRDAGAKCFTSRRSEEKYGELKHSESVTVYDPRARRELVWNAFSLVSRPTVLASMAKWVARVTELLDWHFDTVCSLSAAALPFSSFVAAELRKNVVALDNQTFEFQPPGPPGVSYVLVDTVCQTGNHLLQSAERASASHKKIAGVVFITLNDMMVEGRRRQRFQIIDDMKREGRLVYCYDISYLYHTFSSESVRAKDAAL